MKITKEKTTKQQKLIIENEQLNNYQKELIEEKTALTNVYKKHLTEYKTTLKQTEIHHQIIIDLINIISNMEIVGKNETEINTLLTKSIKIIKIMTKTFLTTQFFKNEQPQTKTEKEN